MAAAANSSASNEGYVGVILLPLSEQQKKIVAPVKREFVPHWGVKIAKPAVAAANTNTTGAGANTPVTQSELQSIISGINTAASAIGARAEANSANALVPNALEPADYAAAGASVAASAAEISSRSMPR